MIIKESENIEYLANKSGKTAKEVSEVIISELINLNLLKLNDSTYWGCPLREIIDWIKFYDLIIFKHLLLSHNIPIDDVAMNKIKDLIIVGNGECPKCGGEMEVTDGEYRIVGGDGYLIPYEYTPIWQEITCDNCSYRERNEPY